MADWFNKNIDEIVQKIGRMAASDFSNKETDIEVNNEFDAIKLGLNWLCEEIEFNSVEKSLCQSRNLELENVLNELSDYKLALDQSAIVAITDSKGTIENVNEMFCKISEYKREELIGQNQNIVSSDFHSNEFWKNMWQTIGKGKVWNDEIRNRTKNGNIYWVNTTIVPIKKVGKKWTKYLAIRFDITEAKKDTETIRLKQKEAIRYQIQLLATQLNPNFVYTYMNSFQLSVLSEKFHYSIDLASNFSNLQRMVMDNSQSLYITIKKEIELLDLFIKMERERTETNFDYSFEIETKELESKAIPPMILLPYVENAIIHGLIRLDREGNICIKIAEKNEQLICEIRDNGVGRNSDNSVDTSETRGETTIRPGKISISENRLSLYKELEGIDFDIETIDLKTKNGAASGTVVRVTLPSMKV